MNRFCVINAEDSKIWDPISFANMFEAGLRKEGDQWDVCELASGAPLPDDILDYCGVVITGSHYNTRDRDSLEWFEPLCKFIRKAAEAGSPKVYGGCFGCQIIAHALGGEVDYNPEKQFALKAENITVLPSFSKYLKGRGTCCDEEKCTCLNIVVSHGECVTKLPPDADHIGTSNSCVHEMYVAGPKKNIIGSQSHPEILDVKYSIYDRIAPVVIDQRQRLVGDQITESMDSFAKFTGEDSRLFLSNISDFLHDNEIVKAREAAKAPKSQSESSAMMASAATRLTSLAETAKAATKSTASAGSASAVRGLSRSASSASNTPASAAARQAQMSETATRLAILANNINSKRTPLTSPNGSSFTSPSGSMRASPTAEQRKTVAPSAAAPPATATATAAAAATTPAGSTTRVSHVIRSAGRGKETVKTPASTATASEAPEASPRSTGSTTTTASSSSVGKDIMAEVVAPAPSVPVASVTTAPVDVTTSATTASVNTSPNRVFAPIVAEKVSVSPEDMKIKDVPATSPTTAATAVVNASSSTPAAATATVEVKPAKAPTFAAVDPNAGSSSLATYGTLSVLSLLFLGGLSFFMYRKWRR